MTRRKFVKKLMSEGFSRNVANWVCRKGGKFGIIALVQVKSQPGVQCITNVVKTKDRIGFRVKRCIDA